MALPAQRCHLYFDEYSVFRQVAVPSRLQIQKRPKGKSIRFIVTEAMYKVLTMSPRKKKMVNPTGHVYGLK